MNKLKNLFNKKSFFLIVLIIVLVVVLFWVFSPKEQQPLPETPGQLEQEIIYEPRTIEEIIQDTTAPEVVPEDIEPLTEIEIRRQQEEMRRLLEALTAPE